MTILEAINSSLYPYAVDESLLAKLCIDSDIDSEDEYVASDREKVARVVIHALQNLVSLVSESNGGYSLSYDVDKIQERICSIARFNGLQDIVQEYDTRSSLTDKTDLW